MSRYSIFALIILTLCEPLVTGLVAQDLPRSQPDLKQAMNLAGQNLTRILSSEHDQLPNFWLRVYEDYSVDHMFFLPGHNLGRWWDAMLRLENATGFAMPADVEQVMLKNTQRFFDNKDHLCLRPLDMPRVDGEIFDFHSPREWLLALNALIEYRKSNWAAQKARDMLASIERLLHPTESWHRDPGAGIWNFAAAHRYEEAGRPDLQPPWGLSAIVSHGRLIEALVEHYRLTGSPRALDLADRFARYHLTETTRPDGRYHGRWDATEDPYVMRGHTHSYLTTLRGLVLYGELVGDHRYIDAVVKTYRRTVSQIVKRSGFVSHDLGKDKADLGEVASAGDAAQIALWLATRHGYTEFLDDVERFVRSRLLPSQITESPPLTKRNADGSPLDPRERIVGAIGGLHRTPHGGKQSVTDVTAAALHTLLDVYHHIAVVRRDALHVNFHLDYEDENVKVESVRAERATVTMDVRNSQNLFVRVPRWTAASAVQLLVNGEAIEKHKIGDFFFVSSDRLPARVTLQYDLPIRKESETTDGVEYKLTWRGDEVIAILPNTTFYPFYPSDNEPPPPLPEVDPVTLVAQPFDLNQVRLLDGPLRAVIERNRKWLLDLDVDRMLHNFRVTAGPPSSAKPMTGWEDPGHILRGSFVGHYLTACTILFASEGDAELKRRAEALVAGLAECQEALQSGYLSAFPETFFDDIEAGEPGRVGISRVSWYVVHKVMLGLLDVHIGFQNQQALEILERMASWASWRMGRLTDAHTQELLNIEHGGMLELLLKLYRVTKNPDHLATAQRFEHRRIFDPLARGEDKILVHLHGNSTVPKILGAASRYELTSNPRDRKIAEYFWNQIVHTRSYVTGGSTNREHWPEPYKLAGELSYSTAESCVPYNVLKLTRHLFTWKPEASYFDVYENTLLNHILAAQNPEDGRMLWYLPLASGYWKNYPSEIYLCCTGTLTESYGKLGDSVFFWDDRGLYVNLFVPSELDWSEKGILVRQETDFPRADSTKLTLRLKQETQLSLRIRIPEWTRNAVVRVN